VYKQKADIRNLLPVFTMAYIDYKNPKSFAQQSTKAIAIGCSVSICVE